MKSSGFELSISTRNIVTKDFTWSTDFIYSHNKNEVTELQGGKNVLLISFPVMDLLLKVILYVPFFLFLLWD